MTPEILGAFWDKDGEYFVSRPNLSAIPANQLPINDCTLPRYGTIRNAQIDFEVEILSETKGIHAAILFRKNGDQYLGAGLGGWSSNYSLFVRNHAGVVGYPIGLGANISQRQIYKFRLEFKAGYVTEFSVDGENLISDQFSIKDTLRSSLSMGCIGLYAYAETLARLKLQVKQLPNRCFIITNINSESKERRERLAAILKRLNVDCELVDATYLRRERPLMRKIKEGIISSDFVIADFGFQAPRDNVLYETGIAHSLGIPTIHLGPTSGKFADLVPSDLKAQFFILEDEIENELPETVREILKSSSGNFDYLGAS